MGPLAKPRDRRVAERRSFMYRLTATLAVAFVLFFGASGARASECFLEIQCGWRGCILVADHNGATHNGLGVLACWAHPARPLWATSLGPGPSHIPLRKGERFCSLSVWDGFHPPTVCEARVPSRIRAILQRWRFARR